METIQIPSAVFGALTQAYANEALEHEFTGINGSFKIVELNSGMAFGLGLLHDKNQVFSLWSNVPKTDPEIARSLMQIIAGPVKITEELPVGLRKAALACGHHLIDDVRISFAPESHSCFNANILLFIEILSLTQELLPMVTGIQTYE